MIQFEKVAKIYPPDIAALRGVSFQIKPGEFVSVVGQSGTGKSTIVKLLIAEQVPTEGKITIGGWNITRIRQREIPILRRQLGVVFQDFKLLPQLTAYENVGFALQVVGAPPIRIKQIVPQVLKIVGLEAQANRYPLQLSGGEQQRVAIARALVHRPKILIADEPTGNLDTIHSREIVDILRKINSFGTTIMLVTHNREIVNALRKRVITLSEGQIVSDQEDGKYIL